MSSSNVNKELTHSVGIERIEQRPGTCLASEAKARVLVRAETSRDGPASRLVRYVRLTGLRLQVVIEYLGKDDIRVYDACVNGAFADDVVSIQGHSCERPPSNCRTICSRGCWVRPSQGLPWFGPAKEREKVEDQEMCSSYSTAERGIHANTLASKVITG